MRGLPIGWVETTLGVLSIWGSGGTPSRSNPAYFGGAIPWVTISDLNDGVIFSTFASITDVGLENSAAKLAPVGSVLVALYGSIGKLGIAGLPLTTNQAIAYSLPNERAFNSKYLFHYLHSERANFLALGSGVTQKNIYLGDLKAYRFPLAPLAEQTRIVEKLEELLSDLDAGVAELKAAQKKLAQYRQSLLKAAVEGALTAEWRKGHTPQETGTQLLARILTERRARWEAKQLAKFAEQGKIPPKDWQKKYPEPVQPDTTDLPELPEGWVWASLDQLVAESSYGTSVKCSYESDGIPVLRIPNVVARKLDLRDLKFTTQSLDLDRADCLAVGDVLVVRTNGSIGLVGRAAEVSVGLPEQFYFASYLLRLRCVEISTSHKWISAFLSSNRGRQWIEGRAASSAGQHNISLSTLLTMPVPVPSLEEQCFSLQSLENAQQAIDDQEKALDTSLKQSAAQRKNILKAAFSGQLVPQDPNDEPAAVLLERIRAERAERDTVKKPRGRKSKETV